MQIDRRSFISLLAVAPGCSASALAEQGQGLFWQVEVGGRSAVVFGYMLLPGSRGPSIVSDGVAAIEQTQSVILAFDNIQCPTVNYNTDTLRPLLPGLSPAVADEAYLALAATQIPRAQLEREGGYTLVQFLLGEGTRGTVNPMTIPSVAGLILDRAIALHLPATVLAAGDEVRKMYCVTLDDFLAANNHVDEKLITSILDLRRRVGPIGAHVERLYLERRTAELALHFKYTAEQGIDLRPGVGREAGVELLFGRLSAYLPSVPKPFVMLPVETVIGADGILERFRQKGAGVSVLA